MKNQDLRAFEQTAKDYPIILTKPFFHFGWSLAKIKDKFSSIKVISFLDFYKKGIKV